MEEKEITINNQKIKIVTKLPPEYIEDNNIKVYLDNTMDLAEDVEEIKNGKTENS